MAFGLPSAYGSFIPNHEGTANLVTSFSRDPATFKIGQWCSYTPMRKPQAYYLKLNFDMCARFMGARSGAYAGAPTIWPYGADAPQLTTGLESFEYTLVKTQRHADGYTLDRDTVNNADWNIQPFQNSVIAQKTMTERTIVGVAAATTTGNYDSTHVASAATWGGGYLNAGTSADPIFKRALQAMFLRIFLDTRGAVKASDMVVVMNPAIANLISQSAEITDFVKNNQFGYSQLKGELLTNWGLPSEYQGFRIVVEDCVYVPTAPGPAGATVPQSGYGAWPWGTVAMLARPGSLISEAGGPSFSTIHVWLREDMTMETQDDPNNRKFTTRIVNDYSIDPVAPVTGCLCTSVVAVQPSASFFPGFMEPGNEFAPTAEAEFIRRRPDEIAGELDQIKQWQHKFEALQAQREHDFRNFQAKLDSLHTTTTVPVAAPAEWETERNSMMARIDELASQLQALKGGGDQGGHRKGR